MFLTVVESMLDGWVKEYLYRYFFSILSFSQLYRSVQLTETNKHVTKEKHKMGKEMSPERDRNVVCITHSVGIERKKISEQKNYNTKAN